ncbi:MAG: DUF4149 domain-containing protein [Phycisphaerales bacterium]|nr:DUF4149 domain-containing protein [Phycisphaerales bacterium]MCB9862328.1 DUF4149 domain-containing protein [Phycisphaerales bacterium]
MNRLFHMLCTLAAGVWLGGMVMIGPFVAKNTFQVMPKIVAEHPNAAAGKIMAKNFSDFDMVQLICAGVLIVGLGILAVGARRKFGPIMRLLMTLVASGTLIYSVQFLTPKITSMQDVVATAENESDIKRTFDEFHESAVMIAKVNLALIAVVLLSLGWAGPPKSFDPNEEVVMPPTPASMP